MWPRGVWQLDVSGRAQPKTAAPPQSQNPSCAPAVACCGDKLLLGACGEERKKGDFELCVERAGFLLWGIQRLSAEMGYRTSVGRKQPTEPSRVQFLWGGNPPVPLGDWTSSDARDSSSCLKRTEAFHYPLVCRKGSVCLATVSTRIQRPLRSF